MVFFCSDDTIRALVTTNEGNIYSNGLALQLYSTLSMEEIRQINKQVIALFRRILTFPMVTVAAINGVCVCTCVCARVCVCAHVFMDVCTCIMHAHMIFMLY